MKTLSERQVKLIVNNVILACKDISKLSKAGYNYLYLASGFIAHYNRFGFIDNYREAGSLRRDILKNTSNNLWNNFRPGDENFEYYQQKALIYQAIVMRIKYMDGAQKVFCG